MTPEVTYNALPEEFKGEQKRRTDFDSTEAKLSYDAKGLIEILKPTVKSNLAWFA